MWGVSDYDARHVVSTFAVWHLPVWTQPGFVVERHTVWWMRCWVAVLTPTLQWSSYVPTSVGDG